MNGHEYSRLLPQVLPGLRHGNVSGARDASPGSWARSRAVAAPRAPSFWGLHPSAAIACTGSCCLALQKRREKRMVAWEVINLMDSGFNSGAYVTKRNDYTVREHVQLNSALKIKETKTTARA